MSRYRNVHCLIWNDDKFPFSSDDCQLVWFHLSTTPLTGPIGIYKASLEGLAAEKRWPLKKYEKAFREGLGKGFWKYDEKHQIVLFPKFFKHNKPENPNVLRSWIKFYEEIPSSELKSESIQSLKDFAEGWGEAFAKVCQTLPITLPQTFPKQYQEQQQYQEQEKDIVAPAPESLSQEKIIETYHAALPELPKVAKWTGKREQHLRVCLRDPDRQSLEWWQKYFARVRGSPFLLGDNQRGWKADLEWLTIESNLIKVCEGKYKKNAREEKPWYERSL